MAKKSATVFIIDDDASVRRALGRLVRSAGFEPRTFAEAGEFLLGDLSVEPACVVADIRLNGTTGLELQKVLIEGGSTLPVIFITAYDTEEARCQAKKQGAIAYFRKPVDDQALLDAIEWSLSQCGDGEKLEASPPS